MDSRNEVLEAVESVSDSARPKINYFRSRRPGPEAELEDALLGDLSLVIDEGKEWWLGSSLPLGAGLPDLLAVRPLALLEGSGHLGRESIEVLAYLRAVGRAHLDTVATRLGFPEHIAESTAAALFEVGALDLGEGPISLTPAWRDVLPDVIAIEFKVSDWRRALAQATRNMLFSHVSFVALPSRLAERVKRSREFAAQGVGIISISDSGDAAIARRGRRRAPRSWRYYYELASRVAQTGW